MAWSSPGQALRRRWRGWWDARHPPSDTLRCTQRNVYIVPTGAGALFAALLLVLLLASINYQLNLGYLLTFLLAGAGLASMHGTHATLRGLEGRLQVGEPAFLGEAQTVTLTLHNPSRRDRHGIGLRWERAPEWVWADVPGGAEHAVHLQHRPSVRGTSGLPRLMLETRFPFGLFRAWTFLRAASPARAWPAPETPAAALPAVHGGGAPRAILHAHVPDTEVAGVRPYRRGDTPQQVAWKKSAQALAGGGELVSRDRAGTTGAECRLDWTATAGLDTEHRLSRLCAWVLLADRSGQPYRLELPGHRVEPGTGPAHRRHCLDLLAGWPA